MAGQRVAPHHGCDHIGLFDGLVFEGLPETADTISVSTRILVN
ncbi:MAG: hypothetical protein ABI574_00075 [Burkholderiales bacterium]